MGMATPLRTGLRPDAIAAFRNRLQKNFRHWSRWARRHETTAFRVYDRDVPEFPLAIDCYGPAEPALGMRLHLQELETGWVQKPEEHAAWIEAVRNAAAAAMDVPAQHIAFKHRPRRHAGAQHEKTGKAGQDFLVVEGGLRFWVNLEAYLDTGLFLDHRALRARVREQARGRRMLNLFAYTGSFTVHAAAGGAVSSTSVDLSNAYLAWAGRNFAANGVDRERHRLVRADVLRWLQEAPGSATRYDLIVLDPPVFSNSAAMTGTLDVQRDHPQLIASCLRLLAPGGELYFSTNLRSFAMAPELTAQCQDITAATRAEDFRDPRVHQAFLFRAPS